MGSDVNSKYGLDVLHKHTCICVSYLYLSHGIMVSLACVFHLNAHNDPYVVL